MIVAGATLNDLKRHARAHGCRTLAQDGLIKASRGVTTAEEVTRLSLVDE